MNRLLAVVCATSMLSCEIAEELLESLRTGERSLSDEDAFRHLRKDRREAPETDVASVMRVIHAEATGDAQMMNDEGVVRLLKRVVHPRNNIDESTFDLVAFEDFGLDLDGPSSKSNCDFDAGNLGDLEDEYMVPHVEKIPVRNQGQRGTCASFAAIGALEYAVLNPQPGEDGHGKLPTLDLSEQQFYWASKEDCQGPSGCECPGCQEGSWYGTGFSASEAAAKLDIPLETDCPYSNKPGDNDTQYPLSASCDVGAVKVEAVESWCGLDDLIVYLQRGYAVPYASPLSSNWEANDGLITKGDLDKPGNTVHAGGHAYLIVGYKLLPDMPEEGGICFYVKNSWGTGWGINGFACQTLAWMQAVTFDGFIRHGQPIVVDVAVRDDLVDADALPDDNEEAEDEEEPDIPDEDEPDPDDEDVLPPPEPDPEPEPAPAPESWTEAKLLGPNESYYRVEVSTQGDHLYVRGLLRGDKGDSKPLQVRNSGGKLSYKGDRVGHYKGDVLRLCTDEWAALCSVRFRDSDRQIYLQFRNDDLRRVKASEHSAEKGEWLSLAVGGLEYGIFLPTDIASVSFLANPKTLIRLGGSEPARLSLKKLTGSTDFQIHLGGQDVGRLKPTSLATSSLCSGDFAQRCRIIGGTRAFVLPRNRGSRKKRE